MSAGLGDKTVNDNYYLLTMAALAQEMRKRKGAKIAKVVLAAGLPLTGFGREKQTFKEYLFRKEQPVRFLYEGERYEIQIEDVKLFHQGYSALFSNNNMVDSISLVLSFHENTDERIEEAVEELIKKEWDKQ